MLVEFSVENFRVFKTQQTFSMVADPRLNIEDIGQVFKSGSNVVPYLHHQACIYGSNNAGKTSLIKAMKFLKNFVRNGFGSQFDNTIDTDEFLFNTENLQKPSKFEIAFLQDDKLYEYGFSVTPEFVEEEWLSIRSENNKEEIKMFSRKRIEDQDEHYDWYINENYLDNELNFLFSGLRPTSLFLSIAGRLSVKRLKNVYDWITKKLVFLIEGNQNKSYRRTTVELLKDKHWQKRIFEFLQQLDLRLHEVIIKKNPSAESNFYKKLPNDIKKIYSKRLERGMIYEIYFVRLDRNGNPVSMPLEEESPKTKVLFDIAGSILQSIKMGCTIVMDELNTGIHPHVFGEIVTMFGELQDPKNPSQLVFTTHDTSIPDNKAISKDQIWLINKDTDFSSSLYSYSDFKTNRKYNFIEDYLRGGLGAIPLIS